MVRRRIRRADWDTEPASMRPAPVPRSFYRHQIQAESRFWLSLSHRPPRDGLPIPCATPRPPDRIVEC